MRNERYRALERGVVVWKLHYWKGEREKAGDRFVAQAEPKTGILLNPHFHRYQIAWGKIGTLEAKFHALSKKHRI